MLHLVHVLVVSPPSKDQIRLDIWCERQVFEIKFSYFYEQSLLGES